MGVEAEGCRGAPESATDVRTSKALLGDETKAEDWFGIRTRI